MTKYAKILMSVSALMVSSSLSANPAACSAYYAAQAQLSVALQEQYEYLVEYDRLKQQADYALQSCSGEAMFICYENYQQEIAMLDEGLAQVDAAVLEADYAVWLAEQELRNSTEPC